VSPNEKPVYHFVFLRHGESIGNAQARWQGQSDYALTEKGRAQAQALAERWRSEDVKFDLIIASPLSRAKETAEIIASAVDAQLEFDPILLERHIGEMEGLTAEEVRKRPQPPYVTPYDPIGGGGEGYWALFLRAGLASSSASPSRKLPGRFAWRFAQPAYECHYWHCSARRSVWCAVPF
jgi:probable phosphoglycerate mutase